MRLEEPQSHLVDSARVLDFMEQACPLVLGDEATHGRSLELGRRPLDVRTELLAAVVDALVAVFPKHRQVIAGLFGPREHLKHACGSLMIAVTGPRLERVMPVGSVDA